MKSSAAGDRPAHGCRLLADGQVGRSLVLVGDALVDAFLLDAVEHGLELADEDHVPVDAHQVGAPVLALLLGRVGHVAVDGNFRRHQAGGFALFGRVDQNGFGHDFCSSF